MQPYSAFENKNPSNIELEEAAEDVSVGASPLLLCVRPPVMVIVVSGCGRGL